MQIYEQISLLLLQSVLCVIVLVFRLRSSADSTAPVPDGLVHLRAHKREELSSAGSSSSSRIVRRGGGAAPGAQWCFSYFTLDDREPTVAASLRSIERYAPGATVVLAVDNAEHHQTTEQEETPPPFHKIQKKFAKIIPPPESGGVVNYPFRINTWKLRPPYNFSYDVWLERFYHGVETCVRRGRERGVQMRYAVYWEDDCRLMRELPLAPAPRVVRPFFASAAAPRLGGRAGASRDRVVVGELPPRSSGGGARDRHHLDVELEDQLLRASSRRLEKFALGAPPFDVNLHTGSSLPNGGTVFEVATVLAKFDVGRLRTRVPEIVEWGVQDQGTQDLIATVRAFDLEQARLFGGGINSVRPLSVAEWAGAAEFSQRWLFRKIQLEMFPEGVLDMLGVLKDSAMRCLRCQIRWKWRCGCRTEIVDVWGGVDVARELSWGGVVAGVLSRVLSFASASTTSSAAKFRCRCPSKAAENCWVGRDCAGECPFIIHGLKDEMVDCRVLTAEEEMVNGGG